MTREEAIKDIQDNILPIVGGKSLLMAIEALAQPEIVRCKDCYHYPNEFADCPLIGWARNENDFCSKAERREG